jgi:hypothetical protein
MAGVRSYASFRAWPCSYKHGRSLILESEAQKIALQLIDSMFVCTNFRKTSSVLRYFCFWDPRRGVGVIEGKGLLRPNIEIVQALLKSRNWDASALASRSGLDLRTVESVIRGDRKQWAVMEEVAASFGVPLTQIVMDLKESEAAWPFYSGIRIYKDWELTCPRKTLPVEIGVLS